jgi:hypothetical protein
VRRCTITNNGGSGIFSSGVFSDNYVVLNGGYGIFANPPSTITSNVIASNRGHGLRCASSTVQGNTITGNGTGTPAGYGVQIATSCALGGNQISGNAAGHFAPGGALVQTSGNACDAALCP